MNTTTDTDTAAKAAALKAALPLIADFILGAKLQPKSVGLRFVVLLRHLECAPFDGLSVRALARSLRVTPAAINAISRRLERVLGPRDWMRPQIRAARSRSLKEAHANGAGPWSSHE